MIPHLGNFTTIHLLPPASSVTEIIAGLKIPQLSGHGLQIRANGVGFRIVLATYKGNIESGWWDANQGQKIVFILS